MNNLEVLEMYDGFPLEERTKKQPNENSTDFQNIFMDTPKKRGDQVSFRPLVDFNDPLYKRFIPMHRYIPGVFQVR